MTHNLIQCEICLWYETHVQASNSYPHPLVSVTPVIIYEKTNKFCITASVVFGNFVQVFLTLVVQVPFKVAV